MRDSSRHTTWTQLAHLGLVVTLAAIAIPTLGAQKPTPTPLLDSRGVPLPFGVQPYFKPEVPLGSGPYKAIMATEAGLSAHVAYYPADLAQLGAKKMPVVIWPFVLIVSVGPPVWVM